MEVGASGASVGPLCHNLRSGLALRALVLRAGSLGALGLSLPHLLAAEARGSDYLGERPPARARSCRARSSI